ncbi:MAG: periplasmic ATP/GTP-binding protein [uncultured Sphingomonadaceae bacterium]|uniref:Periplasmic ATP/GTP-binding protein n=1 Tax=uncultured Sphingomonadaceae bacterium TaxID=169976 RepID=A0A6J4STL2_9SPHN|nr:MAG: periplasmic ATP/GTP-binding protein [uncultured Sphingomonadaceae bacterium]
MTTAIASSLSALFIAVTATAAQVAPAPPAAPFEAGRPLGIMSEGKYAPLSPNVKVYGAVVSAESCVYDATRDLIMVVNRGANQNEVPNDGFVSLLNHDGSVHTARWIGGNREGLTLNHPFGSEIRAGRLYLADSDGGTADGVPRVAVIRMFDVRTGAPAGEVKVAGATWLNDIAVARDGTIYASQTGSADGKTAMRIYRITPAGQATVFLEGAPLSLPNGVAMNENGNVVVANMGNADVLTFTTGGELVRTERAAQPGSDGLVIMGDGTKYLSSVRLGGVSRIRPGKPAELIASGIPSAASMCLDMGANQLVIPMNPNNAVAFVKLK